MFAKGIRIGSLMLFAFGLAAAAPLADRPGDSEPASDGIVTVRSAYVLGETIDRLKQDIASKGIIFFTAIDQSELAAKAGIKLRPSTLFWFCIRRVPGHVARTMGVSGLGGCCPVAARFHFPTAYDYATVPCGRF